jgi:hypothetical protein
MGLVGRRNVECQVGWSAEDSGRMRYLREISGNGKMRYAPLLTVSWMGIDLEQRERRGGYGWERERRGVPEEWLEGGLSSPGRYLSR